MVSVPYAAVMAPALGNLRMYYVPRIASGSAQP